MNTEDLFFVRKTKKILGQHLFVLTNKKILEAEVKLKELELKIAPLIKRKELLEKDINALKVLIDHLTVYKPRRATPSANRALENRRVVRIGDGKTGKSVL